MMRRVAVCVSLLMLISHALPRFTPKDNIDKLWKEAISAKHKREDAENNSDLRQEPGSSFSIGLGSNQYNTAGLPHISSTQPRPHVAESNDRPTRSVDVAGGWATIFRTFPRAHQDIMQNAQTRYAAELKFRKQDFSKALNQLGHSDNYGEKMVYKRSASDGDTRTSSTKATSSRPAPQVFNPSNLLQILGRDPFEKTTHFTRVSATSSGSRSAFQASNDEVGHPVRNQDRVDKTKESVPLLARLSPQVASTLDSFPTGSTLSSRLSKRSVTESAKITQGEKKVIELALTEPDIADSIIRHSKSPEEAIGEMIEAEKAVDSVLHQVLGDPHTSDEADLALIHAMLVSEGPSDLRTSADLPDNTGLHAAVKQGVDNMKSVNGLLESGEQMETVLQTLTTSEHQLDAAIHTVLPHQDEETIKQVRLKRSQPGRYYDPDYKWLIEELNLADINKDQLEKLAISNFIASGEQVSQEPKISYTNTGDKSIMAKPIATYQRHEGRSANRPSTTYQTRLDGASINSLLDAVKPAVPLEMHAAYQGALGVGQYVGSRIRPIVDSVSNTVVHTYIPEARKSVDDALDRVPDDIKQLASQGRLVVETRAEYASQLAQLRLAELTRELSTLRQQQEWGSDISMGLTSSLSSSLVPMLQALLDQTQEALDLAGQVVDKDVKPFVTEKVLEPTYSKVVYPAAQTVKDYVVDYLVEPVSEQTRPVITNYAVPAYASAQDLASSAVSGVNSAAESSKKVYQKSVKPTLVQLANKTQDLAEQVRPVVAQAAKEVAHSFQEELVPPLQHGLSQTLHGVFTGLPSLARKVSYGVHDAAKVFSGKYSQTLKQLKAQALKKKKEGEARDNLIERLGAAVKGLQHEQKGHNKEAFVDTASDDEAEVEDVSDVENDSDMENDDTAELSIEEENNESATSEQSEFSQESSKHQPTLRPKVILKTSTEL